MSLAEALSEGLQVTGIGLIIVFSVLVILMLVMMAMKAIFYKPNKKDKTKEPSKKAETASAPTPAVEVTTVPAAADSGIDEGTLLAVITAAVAAVMDTPASRLNIKSYRRIGDNAPAWNKAGVRDIIDSRF